VHRRNARAVTPPIEHDYAQAVSQGYLAHLSVSVSFQPQQLFFHWPLLILAFNVVEIMESINELVSQADAKKSLDRVAHVAINHSGAS
jgi:hypothetical protein